MEPVSSYEEKHTREESIRSFPRMYIFVSFRETFFFLLTIMAIKNSLPQLSLRNFVVASSIQLAKLITFFSSGNPERATPL